MYRKANNKIMCRSFIGHYKTFTIVMIFLFSYLGIYSQDNDFYKDGFKFSSYADHLNDPRLEHYDVGFYFLDLDLTNTSNYVKGKTRIDLNLTSLFDDQLVFDLKSGMTVDSVKINGNIISFIHADDLIVIDYMHNSDFNADYQVSAEIFYKGSPQDGMIYGISYIGARMFDVTYSLSEPYMTKYWFPCKQVLTDKADSSYFYVTIPENTKAGSNGLLVNEYSIGNGKKRMEWQSSYPIAYYLISVAISEYRDYSFNVDIPGSDISVLVQNFIPDDDNYFNYVREDIQEIEEMLILFSRLWGVYPHYSEKYGHCTAPIGGGMEHQTMTTLGNFSFNLVMHELGHSWFGNYVTCASWQDLWINEGFATYSVNLAHEFLRPENGNNYLLEIQSFAKRAERGSVYVPFEQLWNVGNVFNSQLRYNKGACLVHMIRYIIDDDDMFFSVIREFLSIYGNGTATGEDFRRVLEEETNIDFSNFFNEWYYGEGFPTYNLTWEQNGDNLNIECRQTTTSQTTPLFTIPLEFKIVYDDNTEFTVRENIESNLSAFEINVDRRVADVIPNPDYAILANVRSVNSSDITGLDPVFKIFPNPSDGNVEFLTDITHDYKLELMNISGQVVWENIFNKQSLQLDFSDLDPSIYFIRFYSKNRLYTEKLIIK